MVLALLIASTVTFALAAVNVRVGFRTFSLNVAAIGGALFAAAFVVDRWPW